ncbi:MAG: DUF547 domain-containing protein [Planctomycetes bacterium]|nr:DUF547 domain-containing protein [Planctomycetota bacterium]
MRIVRRLFRHESTFVALALTLLGCVPSAAIEESRPLTKLVRAGVEQGKGTFSHDDFDAILRQYVRANGRVDYAGLAKDHGKLKAYLDRLATAKIAELRREEIFALLINAYNAYTLDLIVRNYPLKSIKDLDKPWDTPFCVVGGEKLTLNDIEHKFLRPKELFDDPRMHFAINCASVGCPPLRAGAYTGKELGKQLDQAVRAALDQERYLRVRDGRVELTKILSWFRDDFVKKYGSVSKFLIPRVGGEAKSILEARGDDALSYQDYDWGLNSG